MRHNGKAMRWGDNDRYWWRFTYSHDKRAYIRHAAILSSGCEEYQGCSLRLTAFGHTLIVALPQIIKPWRVWVDTSHYDWSTSPNSGYWDTGRREYGFTLSEGHLSVALGRVTNDSSTEQRWGCFLPWQEWRFVRRSYYGLDGEHVFDDPLERGVDAWRDLQKRVEALPLTVFRFKDFDGEELTASTRIEELEWRFGTGWFKWLSLFRRARVKRTLEIQFSGETGRRKGSWKGGTIGHSIEMLPGESHEPAFRRYCAENDMTFIGKETS